MALIERQPRGQKACASKGGSICARSASAKLEVGPSTSLGTIVGQLDIARCARSNGNNRARAIIGLDREGVSTRVFNQRILAYRYLIGLWHTQLKASA